MCFSRGSSGWVTGVGKKHEIYVVAFADHLFYDLFSQGHAPSPGLATVLTKL